MAVNVAWESESESESESSTPPPLLLQEWQADIKAEEYKAEELSADIINTQWIQIAVGSYFTFQLQCILQSVNKSWRHVCQYWQIHECSSTGLFYKIYGIIQRYNNQRQKLKEQVCAKVTLHADARLKLAKLEKTLTSRISNIFHRLHHLQKVTIMSFPFMFDKDGRLKSFWPGAPITQDEMYFGFQDYNPNGDQSGVFGDWEGPDEVSRRAVTEDFFLCWSWQNDGWKMVKNHFISRKEYGKIWHRIFNFKQDSVLFMLNQVYGTTHICRFMFVFILLLQNLHEQIEYISADLLDLIAYQKFMQINFPEIKVLFPNADFLRLHHTEDNYEPSTSRTYKYNAWSTHIFSYWTDGIKVAPNIKILHITHLDRRLFRLCKTFGWFEPKNCNKSGLIIKLGSICGLADLFKAFQSHIALITKIKSYWNQHDYAGKCIYKFITQSYWFIHDIGWQTDTRLRNICNSCAIKKIIIYDNFDAALALNGRIAIESLEKHHRRNPHYWEHFDKEFCIDTPADDILEI